MDITVGNIVTVSCLLFTVVASYLKHKYTTDTQEVKIDENKAAIINLKKEVRERDSKQSRRADDFDKRHNDQEVFMKLKDQADKERDRKVDHIIVVTDGLKSELAQVKEMSSNIMSKLDYAVQAFKKGGQNGNS